MPRRRWTWRCRRPGLDQVEVDRRPRLLSDNGPSYVATELADWLGEHSMSHTRGKPYHPMTQGKIERWHLSLKSRILLDNYYLPGDLERAVAAFVEHYNHRRYHESLDNLTPADVYFAARQSSTQDSRSNAKPSTRAANFTSQ